MSFFVKSAISISVFVLAIAVSGMNSSVFADSGDVLVSGSWFTVQKIDFIDDRTIELTFSESLAEEPVEISVSEEVSGKPVGVQGISVKEPERTMVMVKMSQALSASLKYIILVPSAHSMAGNILEQKDAKDGTGTIAPVSLPLSPESVNAKKVSDTSLDEAFKKAQDTGKVSTKTTAVTPESGASAPAKTDSVPVPERAAAVSSASSAVDMASNASSASTASSLAWTKKLPKTGPEEWMLVFVAILVTSLGFFLRRKQS